MHARLDSDGGAEARSEPSKRPKAALHPPPRDFLRNRCQERATGRAAAFPIRTASGSGRNGLAQSRDDKRPAADSPRPANSASMIGHSGTWPPSHCAAIPASVRSKRRKSARLRQISAIWRTAIFWICAQVYRRLSTRRSSSLTSSSVNPSSRVRRMKPSRRT